MKKDLIILASGENEMGKEIVCNALIANGHQPDRGIVIIFSDDSKAHQYIAEDGNPIMPEILKPVKIPEINAGQFEFQSITESKNYINGKKLPRSKKARRTK